MIQVKEIQIHNNVKGYNQSKEQNKSQGLKSDTGINLSMINKLGSGRVIWMIFRKCQVRKYIFIVALYKNKEDED